MIITNKQIIMLSSLIAEGLSVQKDAAEGKKSYLKKVKSTLVAFCKENNEDCPFWMELLDIPIVSVSEPMNICDSSYPDTYVTLMVQLLKDVREEYYLARQLKESHNQTRWALCAFLVSLGSLLATIIITSV